MYADYVNQVRGQLFADDEYAEWVAQFGLNYSLVEALWTDIQELGNIDRFCEKFAHYYWNIPAIKEMARRFTTIECVGSSRLNRYGNEQTEEIAQATSFLRHVTGLLSKGEAINCDIIGCRHSKKEKLICNPKSAASWANRRDHVNDADYASFKALLYIVRQIRNNLFHGNKFDLEREQKKRNIMLIKTASETMEIILDNLGEAEYATRTITP
jgi:hypothetical protein